MEAFEVEELPFDDPSSDSYEDEKIIIQLRQVMNKNVFVTDIMNLKDPFEYTKKLKKQLGCGAIVGEKITLQGDQRENVSKFLQKEGYKNIQIAKTLVFIPGYYNLVEVN